MAHGYNWRVNGDFRHNLSSVLEPQIPRSQVGAQDQQSQDSSLETKTQDTPLLSRILGRPAITTFLLAVIGLLLLLSGIGKPALMYYDEGLFVPEARSFLLKTPDPSPLIQMHSLAKPPLGKLMIAAGMKVAGDTPLGWRVASAVCGALTLVAVYLWVLLLVNDRGLAALAAGLTLFNNFHFVMSRIGMMDVFLVVFLMWSLLAYTAAITLDLGVGRRRILLICSGILMGLSGACKWNAVDSLAVLLVTSVGLLWLARRQPRGSTSALSQHARNIQEIGLPTLLLGLLLAPFGAYALTYWPQCRILNEPFTFRELITLHRTAWQICATWKSNPTIISAWYTWPLSLRPQRGLSYLLGNPIIAWTGLVAVVYCLWRFRKTAALPEGLVFLLYAANLLQWAITPENGLFYYYYYPAMMILGVAIAVALRSLPRTIFGIRLTVAVLLASAIVFLWCYPRMAHLQAPWDCMLGCWS